MTERRQGDVTYKLRSLQSDPIYHVLCVNLILASNKVLFKPSYRADKKFYVDADADADANGIRPKNNMSPPPLVGMGKRGGGHNFLFKISEMV